MEFTTKEEIIDVLVEKWNRKRENFYNTPSNSSVENEWTFKKTLNYYNLLEKEYFITINGSLAHNNLREILSARNK